MNSHSREPHERRYQQGDTMIVVHVGAGGQITMTLEQLAAALTLLGCTEVAA